MAWSTKQLEAIETRQKNILVAAAAGSGKTSVLVERIIRRLTDETDPVTIDRLLVVTFTNAAAAEMRERVGAALREAAAKESGAHLRRQLLLLPSASISTMHAFCQTMIRRYIHMLPIDPKFRVAQTTELMLLEQEAMERLLLAQYESQSEDFLALVDCYSGDDNDSALAELILHLYHFSCSQPWQEKWLSQLSDAFELQTLTDSPWLAVMKKRIAIELEGAAMMAREAYQLIRETEVDGILPTGAIPYAEALLSDIGQIDTARLVVENGTWDEMQQVVSAMQFVTWPRKKWTDTLLKERLKGLRDGWKKKLTEVAEEYFFAGEEDLLRDMNKMAPIMRELGGLAIAYGEEYRACKQERGVLDFNDLEHYCLALLSEEDEHGNMRPSEIARQLQSAYGEIMVDEYQDTNGVQEAIIQMLANQASPNLFFVGDVKQSIYRFRLAEPELFLDKYNRYPTEEGCRRIDLAQNFRSRGGVLAAVNDVFGNLMMHADVTEIGYGEAERLNEGLIYPPHPNAFDHVTECHILTQDTDSDDDLSSFEREAIWIAEYIKDLLAQGKVVYDKDLKDYRPLTRRDIVILLRSVKRAGATMLEALRLQCVPGYTEEESGYFDASEIRTILSLLNIIDNPHQDIPLAAVLRSPIVGMTEAQIADIRLSGEGDLYDALTAAAETNTAAAEFLAKLGSWRTYARGRSVPELISRLYQDTGYYEYVGGMQGGIVRQGNLDALYDRAKAFEADDSCGLFRFLRFIDKMLDGGDDFSTAKTGGENEDLVRIMSVHKSKGLEFPVVILANIGKRFNVEDMKKPILLHKTFGVGPFCIDAQNRYRYPTIARLAIAQQTAAENHAEELRVLYVAMTRAREKLILVGSVGDLAAQQEKWTMLARRAELSRSTIIGAKSWLDWLAPVLAKHSAGVALRLTEDACVAYRPSEAEWKIDCHLVGAPPQEETAEERSDILAAIKRLDPLEADGDIAELDARLTWQYPSRASVTIPAKLSVTEIKRRFAEQEEQAETVVGPTAESYEKPRFLQTKKRLTAAEYGTMMHTVMQMLDLQGDLTEAGIKEQVRTLAEREIIAADLAGEIDCRAIADFFTLPLGKSLLASKDIRRELPFGILLPAETYCKEIGQSEETIFVQGVADLLFLSETGWTLVDYKTDRGADSATLRARYQVQIDLYRNAIEKLTRIPVTKCYLYALATGRVIPMH